MKQILSVMICIGAMLLTGCGGGASVTGKVTYKGEKVSSGNLTFSPVGSDTSGLVTATIGDDGSYTAKGIAPGKNRVVFAVASSAEPVTLKPGEAVKPSPFAGLKVKEDQVEIKAGANPLDIELIRGR